MRGNPVLRGSGITASSLWAYEVAYNGRNGPSVDTNFDIFVDSEGPGFQFSVRLKAPPEPKGLSGPHSSGTHVASSLVSSGEM